MKRGEAISLLIDINYSCQNLSPDAILLVKAPLDDKLSVGN
jgi:hypothetical protein